MKENTIDKVYPNFRLLLYFLFYTLHVTRTDMAPGDGRGLDIPPAGLLVWG